MVSGLGQDGHVRQTGALERQVVEDDRRCSSYGARTQDQLHPLFAQVVGWRSPSSSNMRGFFVEGEKSRTIVALAYSINSKNDRGVMCCDTRRDDDGCSTMDGTVVKMAMLSLASGVGTFKLLFLGVLPLEVP